MTTGYFWLWVSRIAGRIARHSTDRMVLANEVLEGIVRVERAQMQASLTKLRFKANTGTLSRIQRLHLEILEKQNIPEVQQ